MATERGVLVPASLAQTILNAAMIQPDEMIGPDGIEVEYQGFHYVILSRSYRIGTGDEFSPDGLHIVYAPSQEEIDRAQQIDNPSSFWEDFFGDGFGEDSIIPKIMNLAALGIGAYLAVNLINAFRKK